MKLEYRILEVAEGDKQDCNYCLLDFQAEIGFNLNTATHEIAANNKELILPLSALLVRGLWKMVLFLTVNLLTDRPSQPVSEETLIAHTFSSHLENKLGN